MIDTVLIPARRILEYAEKENAGVIVMGSRGPSDIEGLPLGGVSHKVIHMAQCTCITVR
jgi:nucleotide-binding universal stress UspA family protein